MAVRPADCPAGEPDLAMDGSLLNPVAALWDIEGLSPFFWTFPLPAALPEPAAFSPPDGLLTLWGLAPAPLDAL